MKCDQCGKEIFGGGVKFCPECGAKLEEVKLVKCERCGKEFEGRFCPECGTEVPEVNESQAAPEINTVKCQQCGKEFEGKFCSECGAKVPENGKTKCSKCGKEFEGKFCPECGTKSGASPAPAAKPESKLRNRERICMIIAAIAVIVVIGMAAYNLRSGRQNAAPEPTAQVASIDWTGVELKDALPTLPSDNGKIY